MNNFLNKKKWINFRGKTSSEILFELEMTNCYPNSMEIAKIMDVPVIYVSNPGWCAACRSEEDKAVIWINKDQEPIKFKFAIAYELGRLLLGSIGREWTDITPGIVEKSLFDKKVGVWARNLIMPRWKIQPLIYETNLTINQISELFIVPLMQVSIRLDQLRQVKDIE